MVRCKVLIVAGALLCGTAGAQDQRFENPPKEARPYVWWHWMGSNFSKEGIRRDLEAMKESGIAGATIFNLTSAVQESEAAIENNPWPDQTYRSPKYWEAIEYAAEVAEELGPDEQADADAGVVLVVVEQGLAVAVIVLQHDELVGIVVEAVTQLHNRVEVEVPALALDQRHVEHPLIIMTDGLKSSLIQSAIAQDVAIVLSIDNGNPILGVRHQKGRDVSLDSQRHLVPTA